MRNVQLIYQRSIDNILLFLHNIIRFMGISNLIDNYPIWLKFDIIYNADILIASNIYIIINNVNIRT